MNEATKSISIRPAGETDAPAIVRLVSMLAGDLGERSPVDTDYVLSFVRAPGVGILVAERSNEVIGLASYTLRPSLYHAGESCMIEELVVRDDFRSAGIGRDAS